MYIPLTCILRWHTLVNMHTHPSCRPRCHCLKLPVLVQFITSCAGPAVVAWTPTGPNIGFMAPHDETFTIQVRHCPR